MTRSSIAAQLVGADRLEMRKIETQPIRRDQRTFLLHVLAEHLAQRRVQQMRRRMIEHGRLTTRAVDLRGQRVARPRSAPPRPAADVTMKRAGELDRVG